MKTMSFSKLRHLARSATSTVRFRALNRLSLLDSEYDVFISYNHAATRSASRVLSSLLRTYGTSLFRPRRIFRDEDHLVPGNDLPGLIVKALEASRFLALLASPEAARSVWVEDEVKRWCGELRRADRLIIVLTHGCIAIDEGTKEIDWKKTDALLQVLSEFITTVPFYIDLSWIENERQLSLDNLEFRLAINAVVARVVGKDSNTLFGEESKRRRRFVVAISGAAFLFAGLAVLAIGLGMNAERRATISDAQRLAALSSISAYEEPRQSLRLAWAAREVAASVGAFIPQVERAFRRGLREVDGRLIVEKNSLIKDIALSPDGGTLYFLSLDEPSVVQVVELDARGELRSEPSEFVRLDSAIAELYATDQGLVTCQDDGTVCRHQDGGESCIDSGSSLTSCSPATHGAVVINSGKGVLVVWPDVADAETCVMDDRFTFEEPVHRVSADGALFAFTREAEIFLSELGPTCQSLQTRRIGRAKGVVRVLELDQDNRWIVSGDKAGKIHAWRTEPGSDGLEIGKTGFWVESLAVSPDGRYVVAGDRSGEVRAWNWSDGQNASGGEVLAVHVGAVDELAFSSDTRWLFSRALGGVGNDRDLRRWRLIEGRSPPRGGERMHAHERGVMALELYDDYALTAGADGTIIRWSLDGPSLGSTWFESFSDVEESQVAFLPGGDSIVRRHGGQVALIERHLTLKPDEPALYRMERGRRGRRSGRVVYDARMR